MKSLFNNPWFVAGLGVFAMVYLGITVVTPLLTEEPALSSDIGMEMDDYAGTNPAVVASRQNPESRDDIGWLTDIARDPFSGTLLADSQSQPKALPKVGALFVGAGVQAAVVNNRLVRVGDTVDQFRVTDIADEHVQVSRGGQSYRLEPDV